MPEQAPVTQPTCPYLGTLGLDDSVGAHVEYPSFENRCLATEHGDAILLTDQATYCLCSGHRYCPRFRAAAPRSSQATASHPPEQAALQSDQIAATLFALQSEMDEDLVERRGRRRQFTWMAAGIAFASVFLCGSLFAIYTGWQLINQNLTAQQLGRLDTLAEVATTPTPPQVYIVMTATSPPTATPQEVAQAQDAAAPGIAPAATFAFPEAVTATPLANGGQLIAAPLPIGSNPTGAADGVPIVVVAPDVLAGQGDAGPDSLQPPPAELQLQVPTRRPTPIFDVPTSTPMAAEPTPTPSWTPTPLGTPVVIFAPVANQLQQGKCTMVRWDVDNVSAVYYESQGVDGHGEREECVDDALEVYTLVVILPNGAAQTYTTTISMLPPTATPEPTPVPVVNPSPTATWTPPPPTLTPTPDWILGVALSASDGADHVCSAGQSCEVGLLVSNTGNTVDDITLAVVEEGSWPGRLCRLDGVCAQVSLYISSVGPGSTAYVTFKLDIPADAAGEETSYDFRAISDHSQGSVMSDTLTVRIAVQ